MYTMASIILNIQELQIDFLLLCIKYLSPGTSTRYVGRWHQTKLVQMSYLL